MPQPGLGAGGRLLDAGPAGCDHQDELVAWHGRFAETAHLRQPLGPVEQLEGLYPSDLLPPPQLLEFRDVLWLKGSGGLFDGTAAGWFRPVASAASCASVSCRSCNGIASN